MANALTICRIVLSLVLLVPSAFSPPFLVVYGLAGATDALDGFVARRMGAESEFGAGLDSIADYVLVVATLVKVLPAVSVPTWLWVWIALIVIVKLVNVASGYVIHKRPVMLHTIANKIAGLVVFLVPFAIPFTGVAVAAVPACVVATFAAVQEGHFIRMGKGE